MSHPENLFIASMFSGEAYASKQTGLLMASSDDGIVFRNIINTWEPIFTPEGGLRDPMILYLEDQWYMVYSYGAGISSVVFVIKSMDLMHWQPVVMLRVVEDLTDKFNYVDVPQWIIDPQGSVHIIACADNNHNWVEIHPLSTNSSTWCEAENWSMCSVLTDQDGAVLVQGNSFVTTGGGLFYMAFNDIKSDAYYMRTSNDLTSGWSHARMLDIDPSVNGGDSESLIFLSDGTLRFYISSGNFKRHKIWFVDSCDLGKTWTSPRELHFKGFKPPGINWAQIARVVDATGISGMVSRHQA